MNRPVRTDRASRILEITRVVFVDGPYDETISPSVETGWTQQLAKLERVLGH